MSQISQKSISGITSITTPAGVDNQLTLHVNDTSEALKLDHAGNIHIHNHVNTTGISSASNFKTGSSNLHSSGLSAASIDVGNNIKLGNAGVITATSFVGDGSDLTNLPAGLGTALSATATSPLNKMYYTNAVLGIAATTTVDVPASASAAYTQYADINIATDADLIIAEGDDLIPDVLGLADFGTFGGGTAGRLRVSTISNHTANGAPTVQHGLVVTGVTTSTTFSGSGASLTNLNASNIASGTVPTARLGSGTANSSTFLRGDSTFATVTSTTINNNADNRVITGSGTANTLNGEANLTYDGNDLTITGANGNLLNVNHTDGGGAQGVIRTKASQANSSSFIRAEDSGNTYVGLLKYGTSHSAYGALGAGDGALYANSGGGNDVNITIMADSSTGYINFATGGNTERLRIDSSGNVTIYTGNLTIPDSIIHSGDTDTKIVFTDNNIDFQAAGASRFKVTQYATYVQSGHPLAFLASSGATPNMKSGGTNNQDLLFTTGSGNPTRLRIDNNGYVTTPSQPSFRITKTGGPFNTSGGTVVWNNVIHNTGSHYNTSNGRFTAPVAGTYIFHYYSIYQYNSSNDLWDFKLNGSTFAGSRMHYTHDGVGSAWDNITNTQIIELNANDYVEVYASDQTLHGGDWTHFCGHLLG